MKNYKKYILSFPLFFLVFDTSVSWSNDNKEVSAQVFKIDITKDAPERELGKIPVRNSLEGGIWALTEKVEQEGKLSGDRTKHVELENYVQNIMNKLIPKNDNNIRVYVMDRPAFNASVTPNGYSEVWTGLLLRVQTEDELAFVLGHEAGHFLHSHSVTAWEERKKRQNTRLVISLAVTAVALAAASNASSYQQAYDIIDIAGNIVDIAYFSSIAASFAYSRDQERYADIHGYNLSKTAGYFPRAGEYVWEKIISDVEASNLENNKKRLAVANIFNTHPIEVERITYLKQYNEFNQDAKSVMDIQAVEARKKYREIVRPYLAEWLNAELKKRDFGETLSIIDRLLIDEDDKGLLQFYKGEVFRLRGKKDDYERAISAYKIALKSNDAPPATLRQLGEVFTKLSRNDDAKIYYQKYLAENPKAEDAWIIEDILKQYNANVK